MIRVTLSPSAGFCIKSVALNSSTKVSQKGIKLFINIAWDENVPPPPHGSEQAVQDAMHGREDEQDEGALKDGTWFVPVVVSEPREDSDKCA